MPLDLYLDPCTINSRKVLAGMDLLGVPFELHKVDYFAGGHKSPEHTKINPFQTVPAAVDGNLVLTESNAIMQYAGDLKPSDAYPKDLKERANINRWLLWEASSWFPSCYTYVVQNVVQPLLGGKPDPQVLETEDKRWTRYAEILNEQLGKTKWLAGDHVTIADIALAAPMHLYPVCKLPLDDRYPNLKRWLHEGVEKLPCWQKTQGAVNAALMPNQK